MLLDIEEKIKVYVGIWLELCQTESDIGNRYIPGYVNVFVCSLMTSLNTGMISHLKVLVVLRVWSNI